MARKRSDYDLYYHAMKFGIYFIVISRTGFENRISLYLRNSTLMEEETLDTENMIMQFKKKCSRSK